ncbi:xylulokinase [Paraburkholderia guartelaensis]|uniref:Xylulose kinase n=1 Tax=Paraburkholderia guartelaensis TaxID=2546446 RepID=A0A4R5L3J1_9BURK|nr:xylulokinase [Paraburkholderia guartelaensis]TDG02711.1 xylulokinase [Paraburkholderia guartelaensis]
MFLGIDLGTSELKTVLLSDDGVIVASASHPLAISRLRPGWAEQDPEEWWRVTCTTLATLRDSHSIAYAQIRAIGLSGQMHGAVLLDAYDRPLRPAILWNDMRCVSECDELLRRAPMLHALTGNWAMPGFTAPKLLWLARHEPENFKKLACVLLPKDYLRLRLTGERLTDPSDASGTLWLDVARREWSSELLQACDLNCAQVPKIVEGSSPTGFVRPRIASELGLSSGVTVAAGGGDTATSAIGLGAAEDGDGFLSLGTSGVLSVVTGQARISPEMGVHALCHAVPERWHRTSVTLSAASCLRWLCQLSATDESTLLAEVTKVTPDQCAKAPLFLPYLSGERTPHNDPYAQGVFFGLANDDTRATLAYSILEGVAFSIRDGFDAMRADGTRETSLTLIGGGARSAYWAQLIADVLCIHLRRQRNSQSVAALGAARLGSLAVDGDLAGVMRRHYVRDEFHPDLERHSIFLERLQLFRNLYKQIRPLFRTRQSLHFQ